ncbi:MAG TPA: M15 family metallopeptidase [Mycobacteriales bacterium]|nr:M15 family metallopeptidase [Mycobacteriales bacterium]
MALVRSLRSSRARALVPAFSLLSAAVLALAAPEGALAVAAVPSVGKSPPPTSLAALRADVTRTGDRLAAATLAWEQGQTRLGVLVQRRIGTTREAERLQVAAQAAQKRVASLANSLYRNPVDPMVTAVMSGEPRAVSDITMMRRALGQTGMGRRDDAALLGSLAERAQALAVSQDASAAAAIRLQAKLDDDLASLQNDAQASLLRLQSAMAEIRRRQAAEAASGGTCSVPSTADAINGFLPGSALCPLRTAPGHQLVAAAAAAFDALSAAFATAFGTPLCVTDSYRDYATQVRVFRSKPNLAATPGRSQHGWGRAVDLCGGVQHFSSPPHLWLKQNALSFGFTHPDWAEPNGTRPEPWHWEFQG